ncbi:Rieske (2Fe-2S) protein [Pyrobaculum aerophilum]|uniref:(2Fe-2S)-binding protein n=1 Tax=Pyrobaculum aerophilum TaxID=13773 RepID=A0A371QWD8_9CREN|nr:Rieske (2Fe-2S) protein [Pyrobaculum aerophilum]MCX8137180.1 Rieske (2Fe-2S) protein [Pyrobaculum aerophilum]RFA94590.1 (2Fe-2S)-binding protein [Pyrobaculum aerophilum]RFA99194.1 (2Fe-2S)-binding protein [Pyrobaculum aerophilum]
MRIKIKDLAENAITPLPELGAFAVKRGGEIYVYKDECPHAYCNFTTSGQLEGDYIICTCHWCKFDLRTGASLTPELTAEPLRKINFKVEGEELVFT